MKSKRCGLPRTIANSIEKPAYLPMKCGQSSRFSIDPREPKAVCVRQAILKNVGQFNKGAGRVQLTARPANHNPTNEESSLAARHCYPAQKAVRAQASEPHSFMQRIARDVSRSRSVCARRSRHSIAGAGRARHGRWGTRVYWRICRQEKGR